MTHVQKYWKAADVLARCPDVTINDVATIRTWMTGSSNQHLPQHITDEKIILFLHSCYSNIEDTKKCIEEYYRLKLKVSDFFENRDVQRKELVHALNVLHYGIFPKKTPEGYQIVYHKLNDTDPQKYCYNDGFKLMCMMIDAVYVKQGPLPGIILLFDLKGVKLGHVTKVPLLNVKRGLEYLQDAIPVRLQGIHILNCHPIIDKIMLLVRPFLRKQFLSLIHFHKENDQEVFKTLPKECLPSDYEGELESTPDFHEKFIKEMAELRSTFLLEEKFLFGDKVDKKKKFDEMPNLAKLEID